jgi:hypothetical protein
MSYRTIKNYIVRILNSLGYNESEAKFNFEQESDLNFDRHFIVTSPSGEIADGNTLGMTMYPTRHFRVQIAWQLSESAIAEYDLINQGIDEIIKELHDVSNFKDDSIKNFQYKNHQLREEKNYLLAEFNFDALDSVTF